MMTRGRVMAPGRSFALQSQGRKDTMTKRKDPGTHLPRGGFRPGSGRPAMFRGKTTSLITRVRPQTMDKLRHIAAHQGMSVSDALELVVERADPAVAL